MYRMYPSVAHAVENLVKLLYHKWTDSTIQLPIKGSEIEASFGKIQYTADRCTFCPAIEQNLADKILSMFETFSNWDGKQDWYISYQYNLPDNTIIDVQYKDDNRHVKCYKLNNIHSSYFIYTNTESSNWPLQKYVTNISLLLQEKTEMMNIAMFQSVKVSIQKDYIIHSNTNQVNFTYKVIQSWERNSLQEVENAIFNDVPEYNVKLCTSNVPVLNDSIMTEKKNYLFFTSIFLKLQDILEYPVCEEYVLGKNNVHSNIPKSGFFNHII